MSERSLIQEQRQLFHGLQQIITNDRSARASAEALLNSTLQRAAKQKYQKEQETKEKGKNRAYIATKKAMGVKITDTASLGGCVAFIIVCVSIGLFFS